MAFLIFYIAGVLFCGWAAWFTRREEIYQVGDLLTAVVCSFVPVANYICAFIVLAHSGRLDKEIHWD